MGEPVKESFRRYLETSGLIDLISKALAQLYDEEDKPENAINYLKSSLGTPTPEEYDKLNEEKIALEIELEHSKKMISELQEKINELEKTEITNEEVKNDEDEVKNEEDEVKNEEEIKNEVKNEE